MAKGKYKYWLTSEGLLMLEGWARDGLTDDQISKNMGISRSTLNVWKDRYPDISDTLKKGKEVIDRQVENALLKRALGYKYTEIKKKSFMVKDKEVTETTIIEKEVIPDVTAQIFWLKNRKPNEWRDKVTITDDTDLQKIDELIGSIDKLAGQA